MKYNFKVFRYDPSRDEEPHYQNYGVEADPKDRILDCLNTIRWEQDPSLVFRWSCAHGVCGSDAIRINGICALACQKLVGDYKSPDFLIEPIPAFPVVKDLVVDMEPFFAMYRSMKPYLINPSDAPSTERIQTPEDRRLIDDTIKCISCACCTGSCPINIAVNRNYIGPAALVKAHRYIFDNRDKATIDRLRSLDSEDGAWGCKTYFKCTELCPKGIKVTKSITEIKSKIKGSTTAATES
jgi:succinate dehydrogenase / fumarate reductase iron-sulfur subunit